VDIVYVELKNTQTELKTLENLERLVLYSDVTTAEPRTGKATRTSQLHALSSCP